MENKEKMHRKVTEDAEKLKEAVSEIMERLSPERLRLLYITAMVWARE